MSERPKNPVAAADSLLLGVVSLLAVEREERLTGKPLQVKTEVVLANAGLSIGQIANALGKNYDAVRMSIARAKEESAGKRPARIENSAADSHDL